MRATGTSARRIVATSVFVTTSTAAVARPSARPFTTDVVTASNGHNPSSWTSATLSRQKPVAKIERGSLPFCIVVAAGGCGGGEELVTMALEVLAACS